MKVLQIHNHYRYRGGEDVMFEQICGLLRDHGHDVVTFERHSETVKGLGQKVKAFVSGVYARDSERSVDAIIQDERPDLVHIHNLYPLISPSVLEACRTHAMPVIMRCPNYRLVCPTGLHLRHGKVCERCAGGREFWCAISNCRGDIVESTAVALRSAFVRMWGLITSHVSLFVPPSAFVADRLIKSGIPAEKVRVIPNTVSVPQRTTDASQGEYVAFAGRMSEEKGVDSLIAAARRLPHVQFKIAGEGPLLETFRAQAPANIEFSGHLNRASLTEFYNHARMCIVPSVWHEAFGLVAAEAMAQGLPVVASHMGALPEIVDDCETGYLFESGNDADLADRIGQLWSAPRRCREMGMAGREKVLREYTREVYYRRLMDVYTSAAGDAITPVPRAETLPQSA